MSSSCSFGMMVYGDDDDARFINISAPSYHPVKLQKVTVSHSAYLPLFHNNSTADTREYTSINAVAFTFIFIFPFKI